MSKARASAKDLILMGPPGSGKGTQADLIAGRFGLFHLSTGDLFRENVRLGTPLGKLAKGYMDRGEYVPDDVTIGMVEERIDRPDAAAGVIFDGFPRTTEQADALSKALAKRQRRIHGVLIFNVPDEEIIKRLSARRVCPKDGATYNLLSNPPREDGTCDNDGACLVQREDDKAETVKRRLEVYHQQTAPLIEFYRQAGLVQEVNARQPIEVVQAQISLMMKQLD